MGLLQRQSLGEKALASAGHRQRSHQDQHNISVLPKETSTAQCTQQHGACTWSCTCTWHEVSACTVQYGHVRKPSKESSDHKLQVFPSLLWTLKITETEWLGS